MITHTGLSVGQRQEIVDGTLAILWDGIAPPKE
jgi:hypothetical protein